MSFKYFVLIMCLLLPTLYLSIDHLAQDIQRQLDERSLAGKCIAGYIATGIERRDIKVTGSTCEVIKQD